MGGMYYESPKLIYDYFIDCIDYICNGVSNGDNQIMPGRKSKYLQSETIVTEVKTNDWVWHATRGWGKGVAICQDSGNYSIRVMFNDNRNAICQYIIPEDLLNGKISKYQR